MKGVVVGVVGCSVLTFLSSLAVGWYFVNLQFFGVAADRGDHLTAVAAFVVGALVLVSGLPALLHARAALGWSLLVLGLVAVLALLAVDQLQAARALPVDGAGTDSWPLGALVALMCPWALVPPILGGLGLLGVPARPVATGS